MDIFSPYRDYALVKVDIEDSQRTKSGIFLPEWQRGDRDPTRATLLALPQGLSNATLPFGGLDGQHYTFADIQELPRVGEIVYIAYNSLWPEMEMPGQPGVFLLSLDRIVATKTPGGIQPWEGTLLCKEVYDDDVRMGKNGVRERVRHGADPIDSKPEVQTIVVELDPLPIPFHLRVVHIGSLLRGQRETVWEGDIIVAHHSLFAYHAVRQGDSEDASFRTTWEPPKITIEGKQYVTIPRQAVLGVRQRTRNPYPKTIIEAI